MSSDAANEDTDVQLKIEAALSLNRPDFDAAELMSLPMIGALLGHRETATTARYAHLSDDPQRDGAALIGGRIAAAMAAGMGGAEGARLVQISHSKRHKR